MRLAALFLCVALLGCTGISGSDCRPGMIPARTAELFFGRDIGAAEGVSDEDWRHFVDSEIAPRFPDGFTVGDAAGAWRGPGGQMVRERSKRLFLVLSGKSDEAGKLAAIRAAYKSRFHQDAVMLLEGPACVSF